MKYTPEQEISETNETDVYEPREPRKACTTCPINIRCFVKQYPSCNMRMLVLRERAADGLITDAMLKQYEAEYRGE